MAVIIQFDYRSNMFMLLLTLKIEGKAVLNGSQGFRCLHLYLCKRRIDAFSRSPSGWECNICGFILVKAQMEHHKLINGNSSLSILPITECPYPLASRMKSWLAIKLELIPSTIKMFMPPNWQIPLNLYLKGSPYWYLFQLFVVFSPILRGNAKLILTFFFILSQKTKLLSFEKSWFVIICKLQHSGCWKLSVGSNTWMFHMSVSWQVVGIVL